MSKVPEQVWGALPVEEKSFGSSPTALLIGSGPGTTVSQFGGAVRPDGATDFHQ